MEENKRRSLIVIIVVLLALLVGAIFLSTNWSSNGGLQDFDWVGSGGADEIDDELGDELTEISS